MKGLYIHIPFCKSLCTYCDFPKRINQKESYITAYLEKLTKDIDEAFKNHTFDTIYIGGGTPNALSMAQLTFLLKHIAKYDLSHVLEYTIEGNYEFITEEMAELFQHCGVNRVSLGVQTLNSDLGRIINRFSDKNALKSKIEALRAKGITNINLDFMFGLPNQTMEDVKKDLNSILELDVPHVSYYSLILEEKTVLNYQIQNHMVSIIEADLSADMYSLVMNTLKKAGYHHYEISNFAKPGYESKHNLLYWSEMPYIGVGMSAASFIDNKRIYQSKLIDKYLASSDIIINEITIEDQKGEYFWLGLRKLDGVSLKEYENRFHSNPRNDFPIDKLLEEKQLILEDDTLKLSSIGLDHGNYVFECFI